MAIMYNESSVMTNKSHFAISREKGVHKHEGNNCLWASSGKIGSPALPQSGDSFISGRFY